MADLTARQSWGLGTTASAWNTRLGEHLTERAKLAQVTARQGATDSPTAARTTLSHAEGLRNLVAYLHRVNIDDAIHLLGYRVFKARGLFGTAYSPSPSAAKVLAQVGKEINAPALETLVAWAAGELDDLEREFQGQRAEAGAARREAEAAKIELDEANEKRAHLVRTLAATEQELASVQAELAQARRENAFAASHVEAFEGVSDSDESEQEAEEASDFPTAEQLEKTLEKRFANIAPYLYLERRGASGSREPWFVAKDKSGTFYPIGPVSSGMTITQACEARDRILDAKKATA